MKASSNIKKKSTSTKPKPWELPYHPVTNRRGKCGTCGFTGHGSGSCGLQGKHIKPDPERLAREFPPPPPIREVKTLEFLSDQSDNVCTIIEEEQQQDEELEFSIDIHAGFSTEVPNQTVQHELHNTELDQEHEEIITEDMMSLTLEEDLNILSPPFTPEISYTNILPSPPTTTSWTTIPIKQTSGTTSSSSPFINNTPSTNYYSILD